MKNFTIAAAQSSSVKGHIESNVRRHAEFVRAAAEHHADVVVFPELSLTGYEPEIARTHLISMEDERLNPLRELADQFDLTIIAGAPVASSLDKPHIGALVIRSEDALIYLKQHLHTGEEAFFSPGNKRCVIDVKGMNVGLAICADTNEPSHPREAAQNGAAIYAAGVLVTEEGYTPDITLLQGYAVQYGMAVAMANHSTPTGGWIPAGKSAIWDDSGVLIAMADGTNEALVSTLR